MDEYSLNIETFDPNESITISNSRPVPQKPPLRETLLSLVKAFSPRATIGYSMREAEAVGLLHYDGTFRQRSALLALRVVAFFRRFRKHPQTALADFFKDKGRAKLTQRCRNVAGVAMGSNDPQVRAALSKPMPDLAAGSSTGAFDAYRDLMVD